MWVLSSVVHILSKFMLVLKRYLLPCLLLLLLPFLVMLSLGSVIRILENGICGVLGREKVKK